MDCPAMVLATVPTRISMPKFAVLNNISTNGRQSRNQRLHWTVRPSCMHQHHQSSHFLAGPLESGKKNLVSSRTLYVKALPEVGRQRWYLSASGAGEPSSVDSEKSDRHKEGEEEVVDGVTLRHGFLNNNDITIHFVEAGDPTGKLVLLIHGWPNFWYVWKNQFKALSDAGYHAVAIDLRGYNLSSKPDSLEYYVRSAVLDDIVKCIDHFGHGDAAVMVGHDLGSIISWSLAEDHPSKVEKLVTVNTGRLTDFSKILTSNLSQAFRSWYIGAMQIPGVAEFAIAYDNCLVVRSMLKNLIPAMTDDDIERHVKAYSHPGAVKGSISFYRAAVRGLWHPSGEVPVVKTPVTVFWGDKDAFILPIVAQPDKATAPNSKVVHLPESSHWPMWDDPRLFNELLLRTLAETGS
ncbi:hypothetical protein R1sor_007473 [Riccia sorocarpa]|uniref:AB hydrolase-1 domain-containing protein n=1 Tax=Riccia sorocarpa TaxID=122646 RepID=A0ABD3HU18_9MARC